MKRIRIPSHGIRFDNEIMYSHAEIMKRYRSVMQKYIKNPQGYKSYISRLDDEMLAIGVSLTELDQIESSLRTQNKGAYQNGHQEKETE